MKLIGKTIFLIIFLWLGVTSNLTLMNSSSTPHSTERVSLSIMAADPAIFIDGNTQLAAFATGGDGSHGNPYLIANYSIAPTSSHGVEIRNTTKHFILHNVTVDGTGSSGNYGFYFRNVTNGIIENNIARYWKQGFWLESSSNNTLTGNTAKNNLSSGFWLETSSNNTLTGNTASTNSGIAFLLNLSNNKTVTNNTASNSNDGFGFGSSSNNTLTGNTASTNGAGFMLGISSSTNTLIGNTASTNYDGFRLVSSRNTTLTNNTASSNLYNGFYLLSSCNNNTLTSNTANNNNLYGFVLESSCNNNTLTGNTASNNTNGFYLGSSSNNILYLNSIRQNGIQVSSDSANTWHNGTHGNYWSDYNGTDSNDDTIGDTPYVISGGGNNNDPYPLMFDPVRNLYRPSAPQNLAGIAGAGFVALTWMIPITDGGATVTAYQIYRSMTSGTGYTHIGTGPTLSFNDTTVSNGATYCYIVRAVNAIGESPSSNEVMATPTEAISSSEPTTPQSEPKSSAGSPTESTTSPGWTLIALVGALIVISRIHQARRI